MTPRKTADPVAAKLRLANINRKSRLGALEYSDALGAPALSVCFATTGDQDPLIEVVIQKLQELGLQAIFVTDWHANNTLTDRELLDTKADGRRFWKSVNAEIPDPCRGRSGKWNIAVQRKDIELGLADIRALGLVKNEERQWLVVEKTGAALAR